MNGYVCPLCSSSDELVFTPNCMRQLGSKETTAEERCGNERRNVVTIEVALPRAQPRLDRPSHIRATDRDTYLHDTLHTMEILRNTRPFLLSSLHSYEVLRKSLRPKMPIAYSHQSYSVIQFHHSPSSHSTAGSRYRSVHPACLGLFLLEFTNSHTTLASLTYSSAHLPPLILHCLFALVSAASSCIKLTTRPYHCHV